jgi:hypothetical protein
MAITDIDGSSAVFDPAPFTRNFDDGVPHAALSRLPALHGEARRNMHVSQFLARSPQACMALMLAGVLALSWASSSAGSASLRADFAWGFLVLIGIVGMTRNYIRGFARSLRRVPLQQAASDLRMLLLYTGAAWGAGAFLVNARFARARAGGPFPRCARTGCGLDPARCPGCRRFHPAVIFGGRRRRPAGRLAAGCVGCRRGSGQRRHNCRCHHAAPRYAQAENAGTRAALTHSSGGFTAMAL